MTKNSAQLTLRGQYLVRKALRLSGMPLELLIEERDALIAKNERHLTYFQGEALEEYGARMKLFEQEITWKMDGARKEKQEESVVYSSPHSQPYPTRKTETRISRDDASLLDARKEKTLKS